MKSFHHKVSVVTTDEPPSGGLGRALQEIVRALRGQGMEIEVRIPFIRLFVYSFTRFQTLIVPTGPGGLLYLSKPRADRLIVICYHTYFQQSRLVPGQWWKRMFVPLEKRTLRMADEVWCYSECTQHVLEKEYVLNTVKLLPQVLDLQMWSNTTNPTNLKNQTNLCLYIGRPDPRKGYHILQKAWRIVQRDCPTAELRCVTEGNMQQKELIDLVQRADLVIVPSYLEGFGLVAAEAMASGTCVAGCDVQGLRSLIHHGQTGWLVPPGDPKALAGAIVLLLNDAVLRQKIAGRATQDIVRRFDRGVSVRALVEHCL